MPEIIRPGVKWRAPEEMAHPEDVTPKTLLALKRTLSGLPIGEVATEHGNYQILHFPVPGLTSPRLVRGQRLTLVRLPHIRDDVPMNVLVLEEDSESRSGITSKYGRIKRVRLSRIEASRSRIREAESNEDLMDIIADYSEQREDMQAITGSPDISETEVQGIITDLQTGSIVKPQK